MGKSELPGAIEEEKHSFDPSSHISTRFKPDHRSTTSLPRWVKVSVIIFIILIVLFVIMHLTGNGLGNHMSMSVIEYGVHQL